MEARGQRDVSKGPQAKEGGRPPEARKGKETDSPLKPPEGTSPTNVLISQTVRKEICLASSHQVRRHLLQQPHLGNECRPVFSRSSGGYRAGSVEQKA